MTPEVVTGIFTLSGIVLGLGVSYGNKWMETRFQLARDRGTSEVSRRNEQIELISSVLKFAERLKFTFDLMDRNLWIKGVKATRGLYTELRPIDQTLDLINSIVHAQAVIPDRDIQENLEELHQLATVLQIAASQAIENDNATRVLSSDAAEVSRLQFERAIEHLKISHHRSIGTLELINARSQISELDSEFEKKRQRLNIDEDPPPPF